MLCLIVHTLAGVAWTWIKSARLRKAVPTIVGPPSEVCQPQFTGIALVEEEEELTDEDEDDREELLLLDDDDSELDDDEEEELSDDEEEELDDEEDSDEELDDSLLDEDEDDSLDEEEEELAQLTQSTFVTLRVSQDNLLSGLEGLLTKLL